MNSYDEEELEWNTSKIKGFTFGEETPWAELAKVQTISEGASVGQTFKDSNLLAAFEGPRSQPSAVVSDRVKKAARLVSVHFPSSRDPTSISDAVGSHVNTATNQEYLPSDPADLRSELLKAKRKLERLENSKFIALHPKETVLNIFFGKPYSLEFYKSFQDKVDLLNEALKLQDGDAILAVTLFLKQTLSDSKFLEIASTRPLAVRHLSEYLESASKYSELTDLLTSLGQLENVALVHYKRAYGIKDLESRSKRIKAVLNHHFVGQLDRNFVIAHVNLLERLSPVLEADRKNPHISSDPLIPFLGSGNETILDVLTYFCYHHYNAGENLLSSPKALKQMHKITEQQYIWAALKARAKAQNWKDCEELVISRGWFSGKNGKANVDPKGVIRLLNDYQAPNLTLQTFLQLVEDIEERRIYAQRFAVPTVVVDCYLLQRNRIGLSKFMEKLPPDSSEWCYAESALNTSNTKWKN